MDHPSEEVVSVEPSICMVDPPVVTTGHACVEATQETVDAGEDPIDRPPEEAAPVASSACVVAAPEPRDAEAAQETSDPGQALLGTEETSKSERRRADSDVCIARLSDGEGGASADDSWYGLDEEEASKRLEDSRAPEPESGFKPLSWTSKFSRSALRGWGKARHVISKEAQMIREDARMIAADMQLEFRQTAKVAQDLVRKDPTDVTETSRPKGDDRRMDSALAAVRQGLTATAEASKDLLLDLREANREVVGEIRSSVLSWTSRSEDSADRRTEVVAATGGGRSEFLRGTGKKVSKGIAKEAAALGENLRGKHSRSGGTMEDEVVFSIGSDGEEDEEEDGGHAGGEQKTTTDKLVAKSAGDCMTNPGDAPTPSAASGDLEAERRVSGDVDVLFDAGGKFPTDGFSEIDAIFDMGDGADVGGHHVPPVANTDSRELPKQTDAEAGEPMDGCSKEDAVDTAPEHDEIDDLFDIGGVPSGNQSVDGDGDGKQGCVEQHDEIDDLFQLDDKT
uniref:Uncharacterized protein n=1 Tax=Noctiluca scintillans TaxID=2966 RepID=A0A7S1FCS2_NOCSC|mmetsp:Transcript_53141/g.142088  ORF Transcript_53141/g.142088 Transcript_53141/m.142088 type:complete len:510 (+) Transcript_53141:118-1647(+)